MVILDAGIGKIDLAPEKNAHLHVDAFLVKAVAERMITEIKVRQGAHYSGSGKNRANDVVLPKRGVRAFQRADFFGYGCRLHKPLAIKVLPGPISGGYP